MKLRTIFLGLILVVFSGNAVVAQKLIKNMASDVCDCLDQVKDDFKSSEPQELITKCFGPLMSKYEKQLKKKYGEDVFESSDNKKAYEIGVEVGKALAVNCDAYLELFLEKQAEVAASSNEYFNKAEEFYTQGKYQEAIESYTQAIKVDPENQSFYNSRGITYFIQEEYYLAISDFTSAIRLNPNFSLGYYNMAYSKFQLGDAQQGLEDVKTAIKLDTAYCDSYNLLGLIHQNINQLDSAYEAFQVAYSCDSSNALYAFNTAYLLYSNENYKDAIIIFEEALSKGSEDQDIYSYIGNCYNNLGMYDKAVEAHSTYIGLNGDDYIGYYNRGLSLYNTEDYEPAVADFYSAAKCDSTDSDIYYKLGQCFEQLKKYDEAEENLTKAIRMSPDNAGYYDSRASFYASMGKYEQAIEDSKVSLSLYPDDCNIYMLMSTWYKHLKQEEKAEESLKKALELGCEP